MSPGPESVWRAWEEGIAAQVTSIDAASGDGAGGGTEDQPSHPKAIHALASLLCNYVRTTTSQSMDHGLQPTWLWLLYWQWARSWMYWLRCVDQMDPASADEGVVESIKWLDDPIQDELAMALCPICLQVICKDLDDTNNHALLAFTILASIHDALPSAQQETIKETLQMHLAQLPFSPAGSSLEQAQPMSSCKYAGLAQLYFYNDLMSHQPRHLYQSCYGYLLTTLAVESNMDDLDVRLHMGHSLIYPHLASFPPDSLTLMLHHAQEWPMMSDERLCFTWLAAMISCHGDQTKASQILKFMLPTLRKPSKAIPHTDQAIRQWRVRVLVLNQALALPGFASIKMLRSLDSETWHNVTLEILNRGVRFMDKTVHDQESDVKGESLPNLIMEARKESFSDKYLQRYIQNVCMPMSSPHEGQVKKHELWRLYIRHFTLIGLPALTQKHHEVLALCQNQVIPWLYPIAERQLISMITPPTLSNSWFQDIYMSILSISTALIESTEQTPSSSSLISESLVLGLHLLAVLDNFHPSFTKASTGIGLAVRWRWQSRAFLALTDRYFQKLHQETFLRPKTLSALHRTLSPDPMTVSILSLRLHLQWLTWVLTGHLWHELSFDIFERHVQYGSLVLSQLSLPSSPLRGNAVMQWHGEALVVLVHHAFQQLFSLAGTEQSTFTKNDDIKFISSYLAFIEQTFIYLKQQGTFDIKHEEMPCAFHGTMIEEALHACLYAPIMQEDALMSLWRELKAFLDQTASETQAKAQGLSDWYAPVFRLLAPPPHRPTWGLERMQTKENVWRAWRRTINPFQDNCNMDMYDCFIRVWQDIALPDTEKHQWFFFVQDLIQMHRSTHVQSKL